MGTKKAEQEDYIRGIMYFDGHEVCRRRIYIIYGVLCTLMGMKYAEEEYT